MGYSIIVTNKENKYIIEKYEENLYENNVYNTRDINNFDYIIDCTTNFTDLLYWDSNINADNKSVKEVLQNLSDSILRLERDNIQVYDSDNSTETGWDCGKRRIQNSFSTENLPDEERKSILLLHLLDMKKELIEIKELNIKNSDMYCYVTLI